MTIELIEMCIRDSIQVDTCLNGLTFGKQHINFNNGNIQCILKNEKYTFVLRDVYKRQLMTFATLKWLAYSARVTFNPK